MEEKLKAANVESGDSEVRWFHRCQELQAAMQEKEDASAKLEQQLEEQVEQIHVRNAITAASVLKLIRAAGTLLKDTSAVLFPWYQANLSEKYTFINIL